MPQPHRQEEFLKFMNLVDRQLPGETQIHIVVDNLALTKLRGWATGFSAPTLRVAFYSYK
jgi:hypothetical protein